MIKSKETALEMSTSSFLEKERELQSKIEELEDKVEEFNHSIALQKVYSILIIITQLKQFANLKIKIERLSVNWHIH